MSGTPVARTWLLVLLLLFVTLGLQQLAQRGHLYSGYEQGISLTPHLQVFRDPTARLGIHEVVARYQDGVFAATREEDLAFGYTSDAIWTTLEFSNHGTEPVTRYLEVGPPRLQDIRVYHALGDGSFRELRAGLRLPVADRLIPTRQSVFPLEFAPGEYRRLFVRVESDNSMTLDLRLWKPTDFLETTRDVDLLNGLQFGALLLFSLYAFVAAIAMRDRSHFYFGMTLLCHALYDITILQYGYEYLWPDSPGWSLRGPGVVLAFATFSLGMLLAELLETRRRMRIWDRALRGVALLGLCYLPGLLYGDYSAWVQWLNYLVLLQLLLTLTVTIHAVVLGVPGAVLLLGAFLLLWFTSLLRMGQILGLLPHTAMAEYSQGWSMVLGGLLMALLQAERVRKLNTEREDARRALLRAQVNAREEAEQAVALRTQELVSARDAAEASSRAKSAFLTQLSHELRTPLHSILGYSGLMRAETEDTESQRRLDAIRRSGMHLLQLIDGLLDYARGEAGRLQLELHPLRLREFLESVADETRELASRAGMELELEVAAGLPPAMRLDGTRLRQVLINLIANACRHSQARHIRLEARPEPSRRPGLARLALLVRDDGTGIADADRERIFEPFEQGREGGSKGLGLGLAISRQLVALMGGELVLEPATRGSCFRLSLEAEAVDLPWSAVPESAPAPRRYAGPLRRLLVVDDDPDSREVLRDMLVARGFAVDVAEQGLAALARLGAGSIDLVITDQRMPGLGGSGLLAEARRRGFRQPFVLVSAGAAEGPVEEGFAAVLAKPLNQDSLATTVGRLLGLAWLEPPAAGVAAAAGTPPPAQLLEELHRAATEGRLSDIEDWVETAEARHPEARDFICAVRNAARRLDLAAIAAMTKRS